MMQMRVPAFVIQPLAPDRSYTSIMLIDNSECGGRLGTTPGGGVPHSTATDLHPAIPAVDIEHSNNTLDDIFGSSPPRSPASPHTLGSPRHQPEEAFSREPSDIPRLRDIHEKAGYRDGIAEAKGKYVQEGFDEGYSLGAELGLRVGWIMGCLEGLIAALSSRKGGPDVDEALVNYHGDAVELFQSAKQELTIQSVFGPDYFGGDGIWRYEVPAQTEEDFTFQEVAGTHPLVTKWTTTVHDMSRRWAVDLTILEREEGEGEGNS